MDDDMADDGENLDGDTVNELTHVAEHCDDSTIRVAACDVLRRR